MFFSTLQRNSPYSVLIFPILILGLWFPDIINPHFVKKYYDIDPMPLYKPFVVMQELSSFYGTILLLAAMSVNLLLLSQINSSIRLIEKRSSFYLVLFVLLTAILPDFKQLNPMQFASIFIILGFFSLFRVYKNEHSLRTVFEAGISFSIASLFYANAFFFSIVIFIGLFTLVPFNWRQWISAIFGLSTPIIMLFSWAFIADKIPLLLSVISKNLIVWHKVATVELLHIVFVGFVALLFIASLLFSYSGVIKKVAIQKYYFLLFVFFVISILIFFLVPAAGIEVFFFTSIALVFYISNYMLHIKTWVIPEVLFAIMLIMIILLQFASNLFVL